MSAIDRARREDLRWQLILTLNNARPLGTFEVVLLSVVRTTYPDATPIELRRELEYLEGAALVRIERRADNRWHADLTRKAIDIAEYSIDCPPGIARPVTYW